MSENDENNTNGSGSVLEQRKDEIQLKKEIAEAEKAIAEAELAKLKATTATGESKPVEAKISSDTLADSHYIKFKFDQDSPPELKA